MTDKIKKAIPKTPLGNRTVVHQFNDRDQTPYARSYRAAQPLYTNTPPETKDTGPAEPKYFTKENAPTMGWQERIARNRDLAANYREQLGNRSALDISHGKNETDLAQTRMTTDTQKDIRGSIEKGLNARQALQQNFDRGQQSRLFGFKRSERLGSEDFAREQADTQFDRSVELNREKDAADLMGRGVLTSQDQVGDFTFSGPRGVRDFSSPRSSSKVFQRVAPIVKKRSDLKAGTESYEVIQPGGVLNTGSGEITYDKDPLDGIYDEATGQTSIKPEQMSMEQLDALIKKIRSRRQTQE